MEPLWSPGVAAGGNQRQIDGAVNPENKPNPLPPAATVAGDMVKRGRRFESVRGLCIRPQARPFLLIDLREVQLALLWSPFCRLQTLDSPPSLVGAQIDEQVTVAVEPLWR
jgi:hypothetical protein